MVTSTITTALSKTFSIYTNPFHCSLQQAGFNEDKMAALQDLFGPVSGGNHNDVAEQLMLYQRRRRENPALFPALVEVGA